MLERSAKGIDVCGDDAVVVYTSQGPLAAEVARSKLQAAGIPARYATRRSDACGA